MAVAAIDPGVEFRADVAYDLDALKAKGLGTAAIRTARYRGLKVRRFGRRSFVLGSDILKFIQDIPPVDAQPVSA